MRTLALLALAIGCAPLSESRDTGTRSTTDQTPPPTSSTSTTTAPPEVEVELLQPPAQTDRYVFVPNRARDTITRLEVATQDARTVAVASGPEIVLATSDQATAVVFSAGADTVTLLDADTLAATVVPVRPNLNEMALAPDGAFALLWHDTDREDDQDASTGLQSFNELSMVRIADGAHFPTAVGFNPRGISFTADGSAAVVVSDESLAWIDLRAATPAPERIELAPGVVDPPVAEEVVVPPSGDQVWVRPFGATELLLVDRATHAVTSVPAGGNPTDLDLGADGAQVVAVSRASHELRVWEVADPLAPPLVVDLPADVDYGSLTLDPTGAVGVLYTTATPTERFAVWDRATNAITERALVKPVSSAAINPTGSTLVLAHPRTDGPNTDPIFAGSWALTVVDLGSVRSNPLLLPAEPLAIVTSTGGERGYFVMKGEPYLEVLDFVSLLHEQYPLPSLPEFLGVLADPTPGDGDEPFAWVSQAHPLGRITFFDPDDDTLQTLTGFELNSEIEE